MCRFAKEGRLHGTRSARMLKVTSDAQSVVEDSDQEVKFDQEASIAGMKNSLTGEVRNVGGSRNVSKESLVGASALNAVMEKSVREMQSTVKTIVAHIEWVYGTTTGPESAISTWTMEIVGHVVSRSQSIVPDVRTACDVSAEGGGAAAKRRSSLLSGRCLGRWTRLSTRARLRFVQIEHDILWTDLTESSLVRLDELSLLVSLSHVGGAAR